MSGGSGRVHSNRHDRNVGHDPRGEPNSWRAKHDCQGLRHRRLRAVPRLLLPQLHHTTQAGESVDVNMTPILTNGEVLNYCRCLGEELAVVFFVLSRSVLF